MPVPRPRQQQHYRLRHIRGNPCVDSVSIGVGGYSSCATRRRTGETGLPLIVILGLKNGKLQKKNNLEFLSMDVVSPGIPVKANASMVVVGKSKSESVHVISRCPTLPMSSLMWLR